MQMKLDDYKTRFPDRVEPLPKEYAGQWVAWSENRTEILSHGVDMSEVRDQAIARGCACPVLQKIPCGPFVGGA
jgi:hypothetical protein